MATELKADILTGIQQALQTDAPELAVLISGLMRREPVKLGGQARGGAAHDTYAVDLKPFDAQMIADVLHVVEAEEGYNKTFNGRQINLLNSEWDRVTAALGK